VAKSIADVVLDAALDKIGTSIMLTVCSAEPANFAGIAAVKLADDALVGGDFTKSNGDTNGRKTRITAQSAIPIDTSGTATHIALDDGVTLLAVTTCTSQALTSGGTVTVPAHDWEFADPT
jgi:hypothetical protein